MTREEALQWLTSSSPHERLRAARFFLRGAGPADLPALRAARQKEHVAYVIRGLDLALSRISQPADGGLQHDPTEEPDIPARVRRQLEAQAMERISGLVLHEIASPIGLLARAASREIDNYEASKTKRHIDTLQKLMAAIEQLKGATAVPRPEELDLADLLETVASEEVGSTGLEILCQGARPQLIKSDPALLRLTVCNGIRNAIEAEVSRAGAEREPIVISWGETEVDYWVSILDHGPGVQWAGEAVFDLGKSTKAGHIGFGLTIARQAITSLDGTVTLRPGATGGAVYEMRWLK